MGFADAMRRVITGDDLNGQSTVILDAGPSANFRDLLFEIWEDAAAGPLDPRQSEDLGPKTVVLGPAKGNVQVRWFIANPAPEAAPPKSALDAHARSVFAEIGAAHHVVDQSRHSFMHETETLDIICVLQGEALLTLEQGETRLRPGNVVIQRRTNHAWQGIGGPALLLAILIDRRPA